MEFNSAVKVKLLVKTQANIGKESRSLLKCQNPQLMRKQRPGGIKAFKVIFKTQQLSQVLDRSLISQQHLEKEIKFCS